MTALAGALLVVGMSRIEDPEAVDLYDRSIKCWVDLMIASNLGPALGVSAPRHTQVATEAWHQGAIEIGAMLGKDEAAVNADAKVHLDPIVAATKAPGAVLSAVLKPVMERAAQCEAQFTGRH
jgi:hypothetical protein